MVGSQNRRVEGVSRGWSFDGRTVLPANAVRQERLGVNRSPSERPVVPPRASQLARQRARSLRAPKPGRRSSLLPQAGGSYPGRALCFARSSVATMRRFSLAMRNVLDIRARNTRRRRRRFGAAGTRCRHGGEGLSAALRLLGNEDPFGEERGEAQAQPVCPAEGCSPYADEPRGWRPEVSVLRTRQQVMSKHRTSLQCRPQARHTAQSERRRAC